MQYRIGEYHYYTPDAILYHIQYGFLNFSLVFSMCVNKDVLEGCRELSGVHVPSSRGEVSILSTHEWNANFTTPLLGQM
jgi:hypothetical protein